MRLTMLHRADDGERFAPRAWDSQIGKVVPVHLSESRTVSGRLIAAQVATDGRSVELTLELADDEGSTP